MGKGFLPLFNMIVEIIMINRDLFVKLKYITVEVK